MHLEIGTAHMQYCVYTVIIVVRNLLCTISTGSSISTEKEMFKEYLNRLHSIITNSKVEILDQQKLQPP